MRKQRRRSASQSAPLLSLQGLYKSSSTYNQNFKPLTCFHDCTDLFVADLVRNPEDRFSCVTAQIRNNKKSSHKTFQTYTTSTYEVLHKSQCIRKPKICICKNKDADQPCSNCITDQRLCFCSIDSAYNTDHCWTPIGHFCYMYICFTLVITRIG